MATTNGETDEKLDTPKNYTEWILDTIDQLRKRKARPDLERICHMVERKHNASFADIAAELDKLVENQVVVKVDYKGSISYRNAAKWRKSHFGSVQNSSTASAKLEAAVRALTGLDDDSHDETDAAESDRQTLAEASAADIERWLLERDPDTKLVSDALQLALDRDVDAYNLERTEEGNYIIGDPSKKPPPPEKSEKGKNGGKPRSKPKVKKQAAGEKSDNPTAASNPDTPKKKISKKKQTSPEVGPGGDNGQNVDAIKKESPKEKEEKNVPESVPAKPSKISSTQAQIQHILSTIKPEPVKPKVEAKEEEEPEPEPAAPISPSKTPSKSKSTRPSTGKRKRIRKSHGPDFEESFSPPKRERRRVSMEEEEELDDPDDMDDLHTEPGDDDDEPMCDYCLFSYHRADGTEEEMLFCKDCPAKGHPSCMKYSEELGRRARTSPWQCIDCKTCYCCTEASDPINPNKGSDSLLFCDWCDKGYHMDCHSPPVKSKPNGKWMCSRCIVEQGAKIEDGLPGEQSPSDGGGASCLPTPTDSPVPFEATNGATPHTHFAPSVRMNGGVVTPIPKLATTMKAEVPDASEWTIDDVVDFFLSVGFTEQAEVFREQEIDGRSLLLMKRSDVLTGLGLKLGPALKIYAHIQRLQTRGHIIY